MKLCPFYKKNCYRRHFSYFKVYSNCALSIHHRTTFSNQEPTGNSVIDDRDCPKHFLFWHNLSPPGCCRGGLDDCNLLLLVRRFRCNRAIFPCTCIYYKVGMVVRHWRTACFCAGVYVASSSYHIFFMSAFAYNFLALLASACIHLPRLSMTAIYKMLRNF
ncbi:MAG: hypothetical protein N4J56_006503 [Chroococcidiopsis sp. SAG 2025]|nr:hypothetical protein [Chroococcidiopsis sp. SAG 2025]